MNRLSAGTWVVSHHGSSPHDDDRAALRVRAGEVAQRQRVGGHVHADVFHRDDARHVGSICEPLTAAARQGLVVGLEGADALLFEQRGRCRRAVEKARDGRAGIAGHR